MKRYPPSIFTAAIACLAMVLTGCQGGDSSAPEGDTTATPSGASEPSGRALVIGDASIVVSLDADEGQAGFAITGYGIGETLFRVTREMELEGWVAQSYEWIDETTLRIQIKDDVTFWDGSPVDAEAIQGSLERSMELQPGTARLLPAETTFAADGQVLDITIPSPMGSLVNNLARFNFVIKKEAEQEGLLYTGPYMVEEFVEQRHIELVPYEGHRDPPPDQRIVIREIPDENTRVLALQAGDIDVAYQVLPTSGELLAGQGFEVHEFPIVLHLVMLLNPAQQPLDDPAVRHATSYAINRDILVDSVLDGAGTPAYAMAPETMGFSGLVSTQEHDLERAISLLDDAGWVPGADGVRERNGMRLEFSLAFYDARAELEPMAILIQDQLKRVGMDVKIENVADIVSAYVENEFDATMWSQTVAPTGDYIVVAENDFSVPGRTQNDETDDLLAAYHSETDDTEREQIRVRIQEIARENVPLVYLANPHRIVAHSSDVRGYEPYPLENYRFVSYMYIEETAG